MIFLGSFLCGDIMSVPCTPTNVDNIDTIELENGIYDDLYISQDAETEYGITPPQNWDFNTVLYAKFDGNTVAGNVDWSLETTSTILIKRRESEDFNWVTLKTQQVTSADDFNIIGYDVTGQPTITYEYAVVPVLSGIEGTYSSATVECKSKGIVIADENETWFTEFTDGFCDSVTNRPSSKVETLYNKYPTIIRNGNAHYDDVSFVLSFYRLCLLNEETGYMDYKINDKDRIEYHQQAKDFINNDNVKLIKHCDGRMWLCYVTTATSDNADGNYRNRKLYFTATEVGNPKSEEDLYKAGLVTSTEEWWSS